MRDWISRAAILWARLLAFAFSKPALAQKRTATRNALLAFGRWVRAHPLVQAEDNGRRAVTGGMFEARPEWTGQARKNMDDAIAEAQSKLGNVVVRLVDAIGPDAQAVAAYQVLFDVVAQPVVTHQFFKGNRLATKKYDNRNEVFDWTLGPEVRRLPGAVQTDYALSILTKNAFGSTGRKIFQILAAVPIGCGISSGVHAG